MKNIKLFEQYKINECDCNEFNNELKLNPNMVHEYFVDKLSDEDIQNIHTRMGMNNSKILSRRELIASIFSAMD